MTPLEYALEYSGRFGLAVFPCAWRTKVPLAGSHGHLDATTDPDQIRAMFSGRARLNVAANAMLSGLVVVDMDVRNGGDEELRKLEAVHGELPHTPRVLSGSGDGSTHYYFSAPAGVAFPKALAPGVDIKHNGYCLLPGSAHRSGGLYRADLGALFSETAFAPCPEWILRLARSRREHGPAVGPASKTFLYAAFHHEGWAGTELTNGAICVRCPWAEAHSDGRGFGAGRDSSTVLLPPTAEDRIGYFACAHGHCDKRRLADVVEALSEEAVAVAAGQYPQAFARILEICRVREGRAA